MRHGPNGYALATATREGEPHVIPVGFGRVLSDEEILLVDVFMQKSLENMKGNARVTISVWDMESLTGYEFKGQARIETSGSVFDESRQMVKNLFPRLDAKGAVIVTVDSTFLGSAGPEAGKQVE
ncbi:MAG: pyridoxamine 5'-phosphate oxidase family protein [Chloroflexota bacterium]